MSNEGQTLSFTRSGAPHAPTRGKDRAMGFKGPGIACDFLDVEGPLHEAWPPRSPQVLFGDLPLAEFKQASILKITANGTTTSHV